MIRIPDVKVQAFNRPATGNVILGRQAYDIYAGTIALSGALVR